MPPAAHNNLPFEADNPTASPEEVQEIVEHLDEAALDQDESAHSAEYREAAVEVLADQDVDEAARQEVADRLEQADNHMTIKHVDPEDSY